MISISDAFCRNINLYTLRANIDAADSTDESAEDITAADTAPNPKNDTKSGVRYCNTIGNIMLVSVTVNGYGPVYSVSFQAVSDDIISSQKMLFDLRKQKKLTSCFSNSADHYRRYGHQNASKCSDIRENLCSSSCFTGKNSLEIYLQCLHCISAISNQTKEFELFYLPGNATKHQQQPVVYIKPLLFRFHRTYPIHFHVRQTFDMIVAPCEWNAHPQANKNTKQLNNIGIGHRI